MQPAYYCHQDWQKSLSALTQAMLIVQLEEKATEHLEIVSLINNSAKQGNSQS